MLTKTLVITCGLPGSGKSTYVKNRPEYEDALYVSKDDIRIPKLNFEIYKNAENSEIRQNYYFSREDEVRSEFNQKILDGYKTHDIVVADGTYLAKNNRERLINTLWGLGFFDNKDIEIHFVQMRTDKNLCKIRNSCRTGFARVPDDVIDYYDDVLHFVTSKEAMDYSKMLDCWIKIINVYNDSTIDYYVGYRKDE